MLFICLFKLWLALVQSYIETLVRQAYADWYGLEEVDGVSSETALLTQGS